MFLEWREFCVHKLPFLHEQVCQPHQLLPSLIAHNTRSCLGLDTSASSLLPATSPLTIHPPPVHSWMQIASNLLYNKVNIVILNLFYNKSWPLLILRNCCYRIYSLTWSSSYGIYDSRTYCSSLHLSLIVTITKNSWFVNPAESQMIKVGNLNQIILCFNLIGSKQHYTSSYHKFSFGLVETFSRQTSQL